MKALVAEYGILSSAVECGTLYRARACLYLFIGVGVAVKRTGNILDLTVVISDFKDLEKYQRKNMRICHRIYRRRR